MKIKRIMTLVVIMFFVMCTKAYATNPQIIMDGEDTAKVGETKKITVKVSSDTYKVGAISGKIETNEKIEKIQVDEDTAGLNGWSVMYNPETSLFVASKASGTNNASIMEFTCTFKDGETGTAKITLSEIEMSCLLDGEYSTKTIGNVEKGFNIISNTINDEDKDEDDEEQNKDDEEQKEEQDKNNKPEKEEHQDKKDETTTDKNKLPHTGVSGCIILSIGVVGVISFMIYRVYKKNYKGI